MAQRARNSAEYIDLIKSALLEIEDLRATMEYDEESMGEVASFIDRLKKPIDDIHQQMLNNEYCWGKDDLDFIKVIEQVDERLIPFAELLYRINATHTKGLDAA
ncbi:MAG: hypothetical protein DRQ51_09070 [Gammaproteobacteria bacterium]|nr:MAG: hypothetical protein DRQ51_09070 [Gammaproteobacteria bacterium]